MARLGGVRPGQGTTGHYEVRQEVRGHQGLRFAVIWWVPPGGEGKPIRVFDAVEDRLPGLAEAVAGYLVEHELAFSAPAQGQMRRAGVPFQAAPPDAEGPE
jgi:hypothetical protein